MIASLWEVSDPSTAQLMEEFYKKLATGKMTKSEALRKAQLSLLHPNKSNEYSHPYYWSPFILIGNGL
ncbi:MAG: CHAT domain-containing protein [Tolypothrix brevis GSE-NOS-MK-07-07A]|nr:CHAT domain-containing protein [Tolypothrix brevis GSE-NOS-MK-07-07A]